ncbi:unnamed protein product [Arctia plantaginis]|uniref:Major facilitator superfamily (MFS) profile domain-containing protein n=2 Tax=Arctia plantaginis TaxID=874455 RepID=A0A8S0YPE8_ARCPL|nr:unnamed protein product [Arctia plantaginis]
MGNENIDLENLNSASEKLNTDSANDVDVLEKILSHVGSMGRYQRLLLIIMMPFGYTYAFLYFVQIFITVTPQNYWCKIPELANLSMDLRRNLSAPGTAWGSYERCVTFDTNWTEVLDTLTVPPADTALIPCPHGWEFEFSDIPYETVSTEREWVCDRANYAPTAQSAFFCGSIVGTILSGWLADRFGRVPALIGTNLVGGIGGIATTFTTGTWDFILCRFIVGLAFDNCFMLVYILVLEFVEPKWRTVIANIFVASTSAVGSMLLPWLALYIANWRRLLLVTAVPTFIVLYAKWLIPESVRWLLSQGRIKEATSILRRVESINKAKIPDDMMDEFLISSIKMKSPKEQSIRDIFKSPPLCKAMLKLIIVYMGIAIVFDGLIRLSDTFGMSLFTVFTLNEVSEFAAILLVAFILDRVGRRNLSWIPTSLCGVILFISLFVGKGFVLASLVNLARFFCSTSLLSIMQWSTEILPTPFRATGASVLHMCALVAGILSTFIAYSARVWTLLPLLIFILAAFLTSCITLTLPETKGQPLPQSVADTENLIREHSLCGRPEDSEDGPYKKS